MMPPIFNAIWPGRRKMPGTPQVHWVTGPSFVRVWLQYSHLCWLWFVVRLNLFGLMISNSETFWHVRFQDRGGGEKNWTVNTSNRCGHYYKHQQTYSTEFPPPQPFSARRNNNHAQCLLIRWLASLNFQLPSFSMLD